MPRSCNIVITTLMTITQRRRWALIKGIEHIDNVWNNISFSYKYNTNSKIDLLPLRKKNIKYNLKLFSLIQWFLNILYIYILEFYWSLILTVMNW